MSRVFLSYNHQNEAFVRDLYTKLSRDGVDCFFDKESILWGSNFVLELEKAIDECDIIIPCLSPAFCESEWVKIERTSAMLEDPANLKRRMRPLLLEPCNSMVPRFLKPIQYIDVSTPQKFEENYPKICKDLGGVLTETEQTIDRDKLPPVARLPEKNRMPFRSLGNGFIGRVKDLWNINDILLTHKTAVIEGVGVIVGIAGIGKSQLAIEYAHRFCRYYPGGVFWIDAEQGFSGMIDQLLHTTGIDIDNKLEEKDQLNQIWKNLRSYQPILIILDNFPKDEPLQPWLPPYSSISTLVTTRRRDLNYSKIHLDFLSPDEGLALLNSGGRKFEDDAKELVERLGGLTIVLELAKNYLNLRPDLTIKNILEEIEKVGEMKTLGIFAEKYSDELPTGHAKEVSATFRLIWDNISSFAKELLQFISLLAPTPVPRRILRKAFDTDQENKLDDQLNEAISELNNTSSMIELDDENDPWMHRLLSGFIRTTIDEDSDLYDQVIDAIENEMSRVTDEEDIRSFRELVKIMPHAEHIISSQKCSIEQEIDILNYLQWQNSKWGRYRLAEKNGRKAFETSLKHLEHDQPKIAIYQSNLALILKYLGEYNEAKELMHQALESDQKNFEPGHRTIARSQSNLAMILRDLGEYDEAKDLIQQALESDQKNFEPSHPRIAKDKSNLALILRDLGELIEAEKLMRQAFKSAQKNFESGHPVIAISQSNLALILQDLGEFAEAKELMQEALESDQKNFEPGHPAITRSQSNLALILKDLGELVEAEKLMRQALESDQENFEPSHPAIARSQSNLAMILQDLGEYDEAKALMQQALESAKKNFEPGHPNIVIMQYNLETILRDLEKNK